MSKLQTLICDLDGTLVASAPGILAGIREAVAAVFPERTVNPDISVIGPPLPDVFRMVLGEEAEARLDELVFQYRLAYNDHCYRDSHPFANVLDGLSNLRAAGVGCFVLTNKTSVSANRLMQHCGLSSLLDYALSPDDPVSPFGSKIEGARHLCDRYGLQPARTALLGDSRDDREAAEACGMTFYAAGWGYGGVKAANGKAYAGFDEVLKALEQVVASRT